MLYGVSLLDIKIWNKVRWKKKIEKRESIL